MSSFREKHVGPKNQFELDIVQSFTFSYSTGKTGLLNIFYLESSKDTLLRESFSVDSKPALSFCTSNRIRSTILASVTQEIYFIQYSRHASFAKQNILHLSFTFALFIHLKRFKYELSDQVLGHVSFR